MACSRTRFARSLDDALDELALDELALDALDALDELALDELALDAARAARPPPPPPGSLNSPKQAPRLRPQRLG
jgi:hypothetical protein